MNRLALLHSQLRKTIGGRSLPFLSIAGNVFTVKDGENAQNVSNMDRNNGNAVYVDVHVIDASLYMSKMYYVGAFDPNADPVAPTCYSNDGFRPASDVNEPQSEFCAQCPMNAWGSKMTDQGKKGKACSDGWKTAVIVPDHHSEKAIMFRIPPASLQAWLAYVGQFNDYDHPELGRKMDVMDVITRVFFESGKQGILNFMPLNILSPANEEHMEILRTAEALLESKVTDALIGVDMISVEKKEEMLQLAAPDSAPKLVAPAKKLAAPKPAVVEEAVEEEVEEETTEEDDDTPVPVEVPTKAKNTVLPSEMRFKGGAKPAAPAAKPSPAPAARTMPSIANGKTLLKTAAPQGKPAVSAGVKTMLTDLMKIK
jgi:hypothetical protein